MAPVKAASPTEMPMVIMAAWASLMPMRLATSLSCAVDRMARPSRVFISRTQSPAITISGSTKGQELLIKDLYPQEREKTFHESGDTQVGARELDEHQLLKGHGQGDGADEHGGLMFPNRVDEEFVGEHAQQGDQDDGDAHAPDRMESQVMGDEIDAVGSHHVKGRVGDVHDAGNTKGQGKPNGEKGVYAPADKAGDDDVQKHMPSDNQGARPFRPCHGSGGRQLLQRTAYFLYASTTQGGIL